MSIRSKLLLLFALFVFCGLGSIMALVAWQTRADGRANYAASSHAQMERANNYVELLFSLTANNARLIAQMPETLPSRPDLTIHATSKEQLKVPREDMKPSVLALDKRLEEIMKANPAYWALGLGMENGGFIEYPLASWPAGFDPRVRPWYKGNLASKGETAISKIYITPQGNPVCAVTHKIHDANGSVAGVTYVEIKLSTLVDMIDTIRLGKTGRVTMIEDTGMIIASPQFKDAVFTNAKDGKIPGLEDAMTLTDGTYERNVKGVPSTITLYTGFGGWRFVSVMDSQEVFQESNAVIIKLIICAAVLAVVLLGLGYAFARGLTIPIAQLVTAAERTAGGDFNAMPAIRRSDELGKLAASFSAMISQLKERLGFAQGIMNGIVVPFAVADVQGRLTYLNPRLLSYWGVSGKPEDYYGKRSGEFFRGDPNERTLLDKVLDEKKVLADVPMSFFNVRGEKKHMTISASPLWDLDGNLLGSSLMLTDMTEIRAQQERILAMNERITASVKEAHAISNRQEETFDRLSSQLGETSASAMRQDDASSTTMGRLTAMSDTLEALADKARQTTEDTRATRHEAEEGSKVVNESVERILQVAEYAQRTENGMQALNEQASSITHIVELIKDIADQTNLLALNAAIEAARAGEAGRGFAVVADEVRKLAEKTMHATDDVNKSVSALQGEVNANLSLTHETLQLAQTSSSLAQKSGESLNRIVAIAENAAQEVLQISKATAEQSHSGADIAASMSAISNMARQSVQSMQDSDQFVTDLARLSKELKYLIDNMGTERRRIERHAPDAPLEVRVTAGGGSYMLALANISPAGAKLTQKSGTPLQPGTAIRITATPPLANLLNDTAATIIWQADMACGVTFQRPLNVSAEELPRLLAQRRA